MRTSLKVCLIQPVLKAYRLPFYTQLSKRLSQVDIDLKVVYGTPWKNEAKRGDHAELPPSLGLRVKSHMLFGKLFLQPVLRSWIDADLVIVEHANKHLLNYLLAALWGLGIKRVAYWGHGRDRQSNSDTLGERLKSRSLHWADWWFAYTTDAADYVAQQGYHRNRITIVENAIDTLQFRQELASVSDAERLSTLADLGWKKNDRIAVFCGSLYSNKRLDILFEAAEIVHNQHSDFRLLILGGGPQTHDAKAFARERNWVRYLGPKFGRDKAVMLRMAHMWLNPGLVGLGILDAFCASLPFLTTNVPVHSPEIEYLVDGENGFIFDANSQAFAEGILRLLSDDNLFMRMRNGAFLASQRYSIETMVENFATGIEQCLAR